MIADLRYALRNLRRHRSMAAVAILTLALGIGGATSVFSVVDAVVLKPLPFRDPDGLVRIWELTRDGDRFSFSDANYLDLRSASRVMQGVAAYRDLGGTTGRTRTVIGVTGDIRDVRLEVEPGPTLFLPHAQVDLPAMTVVVRTSLDAAGMAQALRAVVRDLDAELPAPPVQRIGANLVGAFAGPRFNTALLAAFAGIALTLAVSGVYAMLAFGVVERRREIAVRLALGAGAEGIMALITRSGLGLALAGVAVGTAAALAMTRVLTSLLYGVEATDPLTFAAAAVLLLAAAAAACYVPARQAARLDPLAILRM